MPSITSSSSCIILFAATAAVLLADETDALRMINLDAPETAFQGDTIQLSCFFSLQPTASTKHIAAPQKSKFTSQLDPRIDPMSGADEHVGKHLEAFGEQLYAIKWYKDEREFFRYLYQDWPRKQSFSMDGIVVDVDKSDNHTVVLKGVSLKTSGTFRCEVSTDAPTFMTKSMMRKMTIYSLPDQGPVIEPLEPLTAPKASKTMMIYLGEPLELVCTSPESKPAAAIDWIINDSLNLSSSSAPQHASLFQIRERRFVRLPSSSPTANARQPSAPTLNHVSFRHTPHHLPIQYSTMYEVHNETIAVPINGSSDGGATVNLASFVNQLAEVSSSRLRLTVDSNLLQAISRPNQRDAASNEPRLNRIVRSPGSPNGVVDFGQFVSLQSRQIRVQLPKSSGDAGAFALPSHYDNGSPRSSRSQAPNVGTSFIAGKRRAPSRLGTTFKIWDKQHKTLIRLKCVARILHLSMSDEFRVRLADKLKTGGDENDLAEATDAQQHKQTASADESSGGTTKYLELERQIYILFFIIATTIVTHHHLNAKLTLTL